MFLIDFKSFFNCLLPQSESFLYPFYDILAMGDFLKSVGDHLKPLTTTRGIFRALSFTIFLGAFLIGADKFYKSIEFSSWTLAGFAVLATFAFVAPDIKEISFNVKEGIFGAKVDPRTTIKRKNERDELVGNTYPVSMSTEDPPEIDIGKDKMELIQAIIKLGEYKK